MEVVCSTQMHAYIHMHTYTHTHTHFLLHALLTCQSQWFNCYNICLCVAVTVQFLYKLHKKFPVVLFSVYYTCLQSLYQLFGLIHSWHSQKLKKILVFGTRYHSLLLHAVTILNNMRPALILYSLCSIWYNFDIFEQWPITIILSINKNYCIQTSQSIYTMIHLEQLQEINDMKLAQKKSTIWEYWRDDLQTSTCQICIISLHTISLLFTCNSIKCAYDDKVNYNMMYTLLLSISFSCISFNTQCTLESQSLLF